MKHFNKIIYSIGLLLMTSCSSTDTLVAPNGFGTNPNKREKIKPNEFIDFIGSDRTDKNDVENPNNDSSKDNKDTTNYTNKKSSDDGKYNITYTNSTYETTGANVIKPNTKIEAKELHIPDNTYSTDGKEVFNKNKSDMPSFNYAYSKRNNSLFRVELGKEYSKKDEIKVNFFEVGISKKDISMIQGNKLDNVELNTTRLLDSKNENHAYNVILSFLDKNKDFETTKREKLDAKNYKMSLNNYENLDANNNLTGIISMSYGYPESNLEMSRFHPDGLYFDKVKSRKLLDGNQYFSNALYSDLYVENNQLRVRSLGNGDFNYNSRYFNNAASKSYMAMSSEAQKLARNDVILGKNVYSQFTTNMFRLNKNDNANSYNILSDDGKTIIKYYEPENATSRGDYDAKAMFLRSYVVGSEGIIKDEGKQGNYYSQGSSFVAPRISRLAYDLKVKYPFMSWNQIKQTILTTAKKDGSGYLNDHVGWGIVDYDKAMKGPSDFNAGLIEEEKYYRGNLDKIFENYNVDKNNHNVYFFTNIKDGEHYTFSNDITSGLKGDGNNKDFTIYTGKGRNFGEVNDGNTANTYRIKVPKVLDSERNYYSNVKQAGLRKAGLGTLTLEGKQFYKTNTQVLEGILELKNDSNSKYQVFEKGTLKLGDYNKSLSSSKYKIDIYNNIQNDGVVEFNSNTNLYNYHASNTSKTKINVGSNKITANEFLVNGDLYYRLNKTTSVKEITETIKANKLDLSHAKFKNPFLNPVVIDNRLIETVDNVSVINGYEKPFRKLDELYPMELRNIPSYDDNAKSFFDEYVKIGKAWSYYGTNHGTYNPYSESGKMLDKESSNLVIEKDSPMFHLINYESDNIDIAKSELFTDVYQNIILADLEKADKIKEINLDKARTDLQGENYAIGLSYSRVGTMIRHPKYSKLNSDINGYILNSTVKVYDNLSVNSNAGFMHGNGYIINNNDGVSSFRNKTLSLGLGLSGNIKNLYGKVDIQGTYNFTNGNRYMQDEIVDYKLNTYSLTSNIGLGYNYKHNNLTVTPEINYNNTIYGIHKFEENLTDVNKPYKTNINTKILSKNKLDLGVKLNYDINNISLFGKTKLNFNLNRNNTLELNTLGVNYKTRFEDMYLIKADLEAGVKVNIRNHGFELKGSIDSNNKLGATGSYELRF